MTHLVAGIDEYHLAIATTFCAQGDCEPVGIVFADLIDTTSLSILHHTTQGLVQARNEA